MRRHRSSSLPLAWLAVAVVIYASLYPFAGWQWPGGASVWELLWLPLPPQRYRFDIWANFLGYIPVAGLIYAAAVRSGHDPKRSWWFAVLVPVVARWQWQRLATRRPGFHLLRGSANQSDIDFTTYAKFLGYSDRIKAHVFDRGNMPLAKIVYDDFWGSGSAMPGLFATFLEDPAQPAPGPYTVRSGGTVLTPGRPLADPGPNRRSYPATGTSRCRRSRN